jgi:hypothetical protein
MKLLALGAVLILTGCVNRATATLAPGANLDTVKSFYVVHQPRDGRNLHELISDKLVFLGYSSTAGPELPQGTYKTDAVVTYVDRRMWDITMYLLELTITFREPVKRQPLAVGNSYHTSLTRLSPEEMIDEVLRNMLKKQPQEPAQASNPTFKSSTSQP